jgi:4-alpha-glucanotransferase
MTSPLDKSLKSDRHQTTPSQTALDRLAMAHGIDIRRPTPDGGTVPIANESKRAILRALNVDVEREHATPSGKRTPPARRAASASRCFLPAYLSEERVWGISLQLYELRSERNWGIGDLEDLKTAIDIVAALGGDFVGLNPLHAPFLSDADRCSPYEPSNRVFLNPLYIAVDQVPGIHVDLKTENLLSNLRAADLVDYSRVASVKLTALKAGWRQWEGENGNSDYVAHDHAAFVREGGEPLRLHALFEALSGEMVARGVGAGWHGWPADYHDPHSPAVTAFAQGHDDEIRFHTWLQWVTHRQLAGAAEHARAAGLRIGLYLDLAVGEALDGSATWSDRGAYLTGATIGSPPDPFAPSGQDWHLAGFQPGKIASGENPPFKRMLTAAMRHAGAIRIDHAAALRRLFLVPLDHEPADGAYVNYPQRELLDILAETSSHYRCLVIGEDLGLLPPGLQEDLADANILSYRILSYERSEEAFKPASAYPALALACISTHDHQTLAGWWRGADIDLRREHEIVSAELTARHEQDRDLERGFLLDALDASDADRPPYDAAGRELADLTVEAHRFIATTPSILAAVRLADLTDEQKPTNVPGTNDSYPNWRPKLSVSLDDLPSLPLVSAISQAMNEERRAAAAGLRGNGGLGLEAPSRTGLSQDLARSIRARPLLAVGIAALLGYAMGKTR